MEKHLINKKFAFQRITVIARFLMVITFILGMAGILWAQITADLVEIESNHLYMVYKGSEDGLKRGDLGNIVRDDIKIAEIKLTSVLVDSSIAEVVRILGSNQIESSDLAAFPQVAVLAVDKQTAKVSAPVSEKTAEAEPTSPLEASLSIGAGDEEKEVPQPQIQETSPVVFVPPPAAIIPVTPPSVEEQPSPDTSSVKEPQGRFEVGKEELNKNAEIAALQSKLQEKDSMIEGLRKEKFQAASDLDQTKKEQDDLKRDLEVLRKEAASVKTFVAKSEKGDDPFERRVDKINQNLTTLQRQCQEEISMAREESRQQLFGEYDRWQKKIDDSQAAYEAQLEKQRGFIKEKQAMMESLKNEKFGLAAELGDRDQKVLTLQKEAAGLREELAAIKDTRSEKIRITQQSLDAKISELSALKADYDTKIKSLQTDADQKLASDQQKWQGQIDTLKQEYEAKIGEQQSTCEDQWGKNEGPLKQKISQLENQLTQMKKDRDEEIQTIKTTKTEELRLAKSSLEQTNKGLNEKIAAMKQGYEGKAAQQQTEYEARIKSIEAERDTIKQSESERIVAVQSQLKERDGRVDALQTEKSKLTQSMKNQESELVSLNAKMAQQQSEYEGKLKSTEVELNKLKQSGDERLSAVQSQLKEKETQFNILQAEKEKLSETVKKQEADLASSSAKAAQQQEEILSIRAPLQEKIEGLNRVLISMEKTQEEKISAAKQEVEQTFQAAQKEWEAKLAVARDELAKLRENKDQEIAVVTAKLSDKEQAMDALVKEKSNLANNLELSGKRLDTANEQLDRGRQEMEEVKRLHEAQIQQAKANLEKQIEELNARMAGASRDYEAKLETADSQAQKAISAEREKWQSQLERQRQESEEKIALNQSESQKKNEELNAQLFQLKESKDGYISTLLAELKEKQDSINFLSSSSAELTDQLRHSNDESAKLADETAGLQKELDILKASELEKIRLAKLPLEERIASLNSELISVTKSYEEKLSAQEKELRKENLLEQAQWKSQLETTTQQYETKLAQQKKTSDETLNNNQAKLYEEIARWRTQHDDLKTQSDGKILSLVSELDAKRTSIDRLTKERESLSAKLEQGNRDMLALNQQLGGLKEELKGIKMTQAEKMASFQRDYEKKFADHQAKGLGDVNALTKELESTKELKNKETLRLEALLKDKDQQVGLLRKEKSDVSFALEQATTQLNKLKEDLITVKASRAEALRGAQEPLEQKINSLNAELTSQKSDYEYRISKAVEESKRQVMENDRQWQDRLVKMKEQYESESEIQQKNWEQKLAQNRLQLQDEIAALTDELIKLKDDKDSELFALQVDYEDRLAVVRDKSREDTDRLNRELFGAGNAAPKILTAQAGGVVPSAIVVSGNGSDDYYLKIRKTILDNFKKFDFLTYQNKADYVKIEFELFANGGLKEKPKFLGTEDEQLKESLYQYFLKALPFPPFPENLNKKSQRFTVVISFKDT